ncbi:MAG: dihydropteroate synthase [Syntrophotaleaceae bacterium]
MAPAIRQIVLPGQEELHRELARSGIGQAEADRLTERAFSRLVKFSDLQPQTAEALAEAMRQAGGEALALPAAAADTSLRDLLLCGCEKDFRQACRSCARNGHLPGDLAAGLNRLLESWIHPPAFLAGRSCRLELDPPLIMGILNVTPDSFYPDSRHLATDQALRRGLQLAAEGADLIDIGGESTRPGAPEISLQEELDRVIPVVERLRKETDRPLSVDTCKSGVARAAIAAGADFINDISGLRFDRQMAEVVAEGGAGLFLMHTRGRPDTMQQDTSYTDLLGDILAYLQLGIDRAIQVGIPEERLAVDPGIGFGKSPRGNLEILQRLPELHGLGRPVLLGTSRKSFIGRVLRQTDPAQRLVGSLATVALGVAAGVQMFRVHDVRASKEAALMAWAVRRQSDI